MNPEQSHIPPTSPERSIQSTYRTVSGYELVFSNENLAVRKTIPLMREHPITHQLTQIGEKEGYIDMVCTHLTGVKEPNRTGFLEQPEPLFVRSADGKDYFVEQPSKTSISKISRFSRWFTLPNYSPDETLLQFFNVFGTKSLSLTYGDGFHRPAIEKLEATGVYYTRDPVRNQKSEYFLAVILPTTTNGNVQKWNTLSQERFLKI